MTQEAMSVILDRLDNLPPMPTVVMKVLTVVRDPQSTVKDIVGVIRLDEILTFQVLKIANSAFYSRTPQQISTLDEALKKLGNNALINIVLAGSCNKYFSGAGEGYDLKRGELWRHSLACALLSQRLSALSGFQQKEMLFTACILHDIGKSLLDAFVSGKQAEIRQALGKGNVTFTRAEMEVLGVSHSELGARLLEKWNFPPEIVSAVRYHHEPQRAVNAAKMAYHVHLCDVICLMIGVGLGLGGLSYESQEEVFRMFQLSETDVQRLFMALFEDLQKAEEFLKI